MQNTISTKLALIRGTEIMFSTVVNPILDPTIKSDDSDFTLTIDLSNVTWKSHAVVGFGAILLVLAIALPLWAYRNLKIDFPPIVGDDAVVTTCNQAINVQVLMNDADPIGALDVRTVAIERSGAHGLVTPSPDTGIVTYSPHAGYVGRDVFTYSVRNRDGSRSNIGTVQVTVNP
jgi:hypothetical protein